MLGVISRRYDRRLKDRLPLVLLVTEPGMELLAKWKCGFQSPSSNITEYERVIFVLIDNNSVTGTGLFSLFLQHAEVDYYLAPVWFFGKEKLTDRSY